MLDPKRVKSKRILYRIVYMVFIYTAFCYFRPVENEWI
jgi:hypothetical protein